MKKEDDKPIGHVVVPESYRESLFRTRNRLSPPAHEHPPNLYETSANASSFSSSSTLLHVSLRTDRADDAMLYVEASRRLAVGDEVRRLYKAVERGEQPTAP